MKAKSLLLAFVAFSLSANHAVAVEFPHVSVTDGICVNVDPRGLSLEDANKLRAAGVSGVRAPFSWSLIEYGGAGNWDWDQNDWYGTFFSTCAQAGLRVYGTLQNTNPRYYQNPYDPVTHEDLYSAYQLNEGAAYLGSSAFRNQYDSFVQQTVSHFTDLSNTLAQQNPNWNPSVTWEVWNEPNLGEWPGNNAGDYVKLAVGSSGDNHPEGACDVIRSAAASVGGVASQPTIIGPTVASYPGNPGDPWAVDPTNYLTTCLTYRDVNGLGLLDKIDGLSVHLYRASNPETIADVSSSLSPNPNYAAIRDLMTTYGGAKGSTLPILSGEWGYNSAETGLQTQADYLQRMMLTNFSQTFANGSPSVPVSTWFMDTDNPQQLWTFGLFENINAWGASPYGAPKPSYYAMQALTVSLSGKTLSSKIAGSSTDWLLEFTGDGRKKLAAWTTSLTPYSKTQSGYGTFYLNSTPLYLGEMQQWQSGAWSNNTWTNALGGGTGYWVSGSQAKFATANATVSVNTTACFSGLQFNANNVTLSDGGGQLQMTLGGGVIYTGSNNATINAPINNQAPAYPCDPAACQVRKSGSGTLALGGNNQFTGNLIIYEGTVQANSADALKGPVVTLNYTPLVGSCLTFGTGIGTFNVGGLSGSGNLSLTNTSGGAIALSVGGANYLTYYSGMLSGSGSLVKVGTNDLVLSRANTYSGPTTISGGSIVMGNAQAFGSTSPITLNGGVLSMDGYSLSGHQLTVASNGGGISNWNTGPTSVLTPSSVSITSDFAVFGTGNIELAGAFVSSGATFRTLGKYGTGMLTLSGGANTDNAYLNLAANEGTVLLSKQSSYDHHAAANVAVGPGATVQYGGSGQYQVWQNGSMTLNGGTVDFNGRHQEGTSMYIFQNGATIANSGTVMRYAPTSIAVNPISNFSVTTGSGVDLDTAIVCDTANLTVWPHLQKFGSGILALGGGATCNTNLTVDAIEGTIFLNKGSSAANNIYAALALSVGPQGFVQYGGSGDGQMAPTGGWIHLQGGTLDFNGRDQMGTDPTVMTAGSTLANSAANTTSHYTPNSFTYQQNFTVSTVGDLEINGAVVGNSSNWPVLNKTDAGTLILSGTTDNTCLTFGVWGGTVELNKQNTSIYGVHAATAVSITPQGTVQYTGSGDYQVSEWIALNGGVLDLNGKNQGKIWIPVNVAGSTLANTALGTTSTIDSASGVALNANLTVNAVGDLKIDTAVSGTGGLTKTGVGNLFLTKANTYSGGTFVNQGTLVADFTATSAPTADILKSTAALTLAGGTLHTQFYIPGNSQTVSGTSVASGASGVLANTAGGTVNLNAITRNVGGTVNFTTAQGANIRTSTANCNFSSRRSIIGGYATYGGNTWAVSGTTGGPWNISGLSTFQTTFAATNDVNASGSNTISSSVAINSLRFNNSSSASVSINSSRTLTVATGGILMTPDAGAVTIGGSGNLTTGNGQDLIVHQNSINNTMTINANITGTGKGLTKSGGGRLILSGSKSYTGATTVNQGTLALSSGTLSGTSGITLNAGGTLLQNSSTALNKSITFNGGTLGGTGWYTNPVTNGIMTVGNGSHLSPGDGGVGTLTIGATYDNLTLNMDSSTVLDFDLSSGACDKTVLSTRTSRHLTLDGTMFINWAGALTEGNYTIFSGYSSYTDNGLVFGNVPTGHSYTCHFDPNAHAVYVTVAPEPSTIVILATALLSLVGYTWRKRRRIG